ncbi:MAG: zinc ribbon domain-containing protein [Dehalococcoidia bacterium]
MPLYVYRCDDCDERFEVFLRTPRASSPSTCEHCGSKNIKRQVAGFAVANSELDRLRALDPQYKRMVEDHVRDTPEADPMRHLEKMIPFDAAQEVGDPVDF